jgi:preprotein translocase subunit SecY
MMRTATSVLSLPVLRRRILSLTVALLVVRLIVQVRLPRIPFDLGTFFSENPYLALFDVFTGGAASHGSILALGVYPYLIGNWLAAQTLTKSQVQEGYEASQQLQHVRARFLTVAVAILMGSLYVALVYRAGTAQDKLGLLGIVFLMVLVAVCGVLAQRIILARQKPLMLELMVSLSMPLGGPIPRYSDAPPDTRRLYEMWERLYTITRIATAAIVVLLGAVYLFVLFRLGTGALPSRIAGIALVVVLTAGSMLYVWLATAAGDDGFGMLMAGNVLAALPRYLFAEIQSPLDLIGRVMVILLVVGAYLVVANGIRKVSVNYAHQV